MTLPPAPEHVNVYEVFEVGDCVDVPDIACVPDQPLLAEHDVAFVEVHVNVADDPALIFATFDTIVIVGAAGTGVGEVVDDPPPPPPQPARVINAANVTAKF